VQRQLSSRQVLDPWTCEWVTGHGSQVMGHRSRVTGHRSRVTGHGSWVTGHGSQVTGHPCHHLPTCQCSASYALPLST